MKHYENHIVMIGAFHLICGYLKMLGNKLKGTGSSDILIEAVLISSDSLNRVMSAKNYSKSIHCHKIVEETPERLMISKYLDTRWEEVPFVQVCDYRTVLIKYYIQPDNMTENGVLNDVGVMSYIKGYGQFRTMCVQENGNPVDGIHWSRLASVDSPTGCENEQLRCLRRTHLSHAWVILQFREWKLRKVHNPFWMFIANIELSHPGSIDLLRKGAISVARSFVPGNWCAVDKTIEETIMKNTKSRGGSGSSSAGLTEL